MRFNSLQFVLFFLLVLGVAAVLQRNVKARNVALLVASYLFYGCWDFRFLFLIVVTTCVDWATGWLLDEKSEKSGWARRVAQHRRLLLTLCVGVNLGILGFFKYFDFFVESGASVLNWLGMNVTPTTLGWILPVGISFYTLQSMSYSIDVFRRQRRAEANLLNYALFVAFFPQLVAGPIERASHMLSQFGSERPMGLIRLKTGLGLMGLGMIKKVVLADNLALPIEQVFSSLEPSGFAVWLSVIAFALQIYFDFSAYTDIARGAACCLGFDLVENFCRPYLSRNPREFWRRWHMSLGAWLRDYLYIPLGGNKKGRLRVRLNLMITMLLGGLWHGASWLYVFWGAWHGLWLWLHRSLEPVLGIMAHSRFKTIRLVWATLSIVVTFHMVCIGWLFFRSESLVVLGRMLLGLLYDPSLRMEDFGTNGFQTVLCCIIGGILLECLEFKARGSFSFWKWSFEKQALAYALGIVVFLLFGEFQGEPFIYFQF